MKKPNIRALAASFTLTMIICALIIAIILASVLVSALIIFISVELGLMDLLWRDGIPPTAVLLISSLVVLVIGITITATVGRVPLRPVKKLVSQMNRLASGDFSARLEFGPPLGAHPAVKEISDSFNKMAEELGNTELLRSDFVNNFSHEFKTPIVSISGFAKLLKSPDLTESERAEYISIIEEESLRLSSMATNVLNLSKIESQSILTDTAHYNLSEQLRSAMLLFERKWQSKGLSPELDMGEHSIEANEALLLQVWINLFDNAIKFSPDGSEISVSVTEGEKTLTVAVTNAGDPIPADSLPKIFNKFFRADNSYEGNGIGLSLAKKIVELHGGRIEAKSDSTATVFTVTLPKSR